MYVGPHTFKALSDVEMCEKLPFFYANSGDVHPCIGATVSVDSTRINSTFDCWIQLFFNVFYW